jgi:uncharacterized protein (TIGR03083 family)
VDAHTYAAHLRADGEAMAAAATGNLDNLVPSCADWNMADLVRHTGEVHRFWGAVAGQQLQDPSAVESDHGPERDQLINWFTQGVAELADLLEHADGSQPVWTWATQNDVAWVQRRMAQETTVHRWDAQAAAGAPRPIDAELAADGVDEFLDVFLAHPEMKARYAEGSESVHLHSTDAPGEWLIEVAGGELAVRREHSKGDAAVRATASDLLLLLWRRRSPAELEVFGDVAAIQQFVARTKVE